MPTQRTVQFSMDFDVKNLNTIEELENSLEGINDELKTLDVNSEAFKELSKQAQAADGKLRTIEDSLGGVTSAEKADGVLKLGEGLAGAFAIGASASIFFGEKASENIEKTVAAVGSLVVALDGVKKITEALSAQNLKFVKGAIDGFKKSAVASKLFGTTTRAAIASTGIGLLVIAIGLIIANWEKLTKAIKKNGKQIKNALLFIAPPLYLIITLIEKIMEKVGDLQNLLAAVGAFIKKLFTFDGSGLKGATEEFEKQLEIQKEMDVLRDEYNKKIEETEDAYNRELTLLKEQGAEQEEINKVIRDRLETEQKLLKRMVTLGEATDEQVKRLEEVNFQLQLQDIREKKLVEQRKKEAAEAKKVAEAKKKADALEKARIERAKAELLIATENAKIQGVIDKIIADESVALEYINLTLQENNQLNQDQLDLIIAANEALDEVLQTSNLNIRAAERYIEKLDEMVNRASQIQPPTDDSEELVKLLTDASNEYAKQRDIIKDIDAFIKSYTDNYPPDQGVVLFLTNEMKAQLAYLEGQKKEAQEKAKIDTLTLDAAEKATKRTIEASEQLKIQNLLKIDQLKASYELAETDLDRQLIINDINTLKSSQIELDQGIYTQQLNLKRIEQERVSIGKDVVAIQSEQNKIIADNAGVYLNKWQAAQLQLRKFFSVTWKEMGKDVEKFFTEGIGEQMLLIADSISMLFNSIASMAQTTLSNLEIGLEEWYNNNAERMEELAELREGYASEEEELNELLKDAEGDRYDDLLAQIEAVQKKDAEAAEQEKILANQEIAHLNAIEVAREEADRAEKRAALISAAIQGALAVISALKKGFIVAGITAAAVGVGIASIAKQKIVPAKVIPPIAAEGMLVGESHAAGGVNVEAEGGEFVVNKGATRAFLPLIEKINNAGKKFAEGDVIGQVAPATPAATDELIDYEMLAEAIAARPSFVSVVEFNEVANRLKAVESRSSI